MRRLVIACASLALVLGLANVAESAPAEGASTVGVNHVSTDGDQHTSFSVKDYGPDSLDRGNFNYHNRSTGLSYNVDVGCVEVVGNRATFAFVIPEGPGAGNAKIIEVIDNGEPTGGPPPDLYGDTTGTVPLATACNFINNGFVLGIYNEQVTSGNIQVRS